MKCAKVHCSTFIRNKDCPICNNTHTLALDGGKLITTIKVIMKSYKIRVITYTYWYFDKGSLLPKGLSYQVATQDQKHLASVIHFHVWWLLLGAHVYIYIIMLMTQSAIDILINTCKYVYMYKDTSFKGNVWGPKHWTYISKVPQNRWLSHVWFSQTWYGARSSSILISLREYPADSTLCRPI